MKKSVLKLLNGLIVFSAAAYLATACMLAAVIWQKPGFLPLFYTVLMAVYSILMLAVLFLFKKAVLLRLGREELYRTEGPNRRP